MDAIAFWLSAFLVIGLFSVLSLGVLRLVAAGLPRNVARLAAVAIGAALAIGFRALAHADGGSLRWDLSVDYLLPAAAMLALVSLLGRRKPDDA